MSAASPAMSVEDARRHAEQIVRRSGTSFGAGMRILSKERRAAMYAVYAFCREVDDIADEDGALDEKRAGLKQWREEIERLYAGRATLPASIALAEHIERFDLPKQEFHLVIEGMEMDADGPVVAPSMAELLRYTRRAAGAVGMLSMPIFGAPRNQAAENFALALGDALQLTNILRDVEEDASQGRIYLPRELLEKHDCTMAPGSIAADPGLPEVRAALAAVAGQKFKDTRIALGGLDRKTLRPALLMMGVYERYFEKMTARRWANGQPKVELSKLEKMLIAARWFVFPQIS